MFVKRNWDQEIYDFLVNAITSSPGVAAFDFDNTLIKGDLGEEVMFYLIRNGLEHFKGQFENYFRDKEKASVVWKKKNTNKDDFVDFILDEYKYLYHNRSLEEAYRWSSFLFSSWSQIELQNISKRIWQQKLKQNIYLEMWELIRFLNQKNWKVYIITASPTWVIQAIIADFHLPKNHVYGMNVELDKDNKTTPDIIEPFTYGIGKVKTMHNIIGKNSDLCFGDSINDIPLLESANLKGILIDRGDQELSKKASEIGCYIQHQFK